MMPSRLRQRIEIMPRAWLAQAVRSRPPERPADPRTILIAHHLLLGDTMSLVPLLAALRAQHPDALILLTVPPALLPIFAGRPYGVVPVAYAPNQLGVLKRIAAARQAYAPRPNTSKLLDDAHGFDWAIIPGENRFAALARAAGARWIIAHAGDRPAYKNHLVDELVPWPAWPWNWAEMIASLAAPMPHTSTRIPFVPRSWPVPQAAQFAAPPSPYIVLHVGARNPLRRWLPARWRAVADALHARGYTIAWSGGPDDTDAIAQVAPQPHEHSLCGALDLAQLWQLLNGAALLISTDTGIPHLARTASCPNLVLFGPGSATMSGSPAFFANVPSEAVGASTFHCRDQHVAFKRDTPGMARCVRFAPACVDNRCMQVIAADEVLAAALGLLDTPAVR